MSKIESEYSVKINVVVQPTHCYDLNALDALINSSIKKEMREKKPPQTHAHLIRDFTAAVKDSCHSRTIQRSFVRAYSRNSHGDKDHSLVPASILSWYADDGYSTSDEDSVET